MFSAPNGNSHHLSCIKKPSHTHLNVSPSFSCCHSNPHPVVVLVLSFDTWEPLTSADRQGSPLSLAHCTRVYHFVQQCVLHLMLVKSLFSVMHFKQPRFQTSAALDAEGLLCLCMCMCACVYWHRAAEQSILMISYRHLKLIWEPGRMGGKEVRWWHERREIVHNLPLISDQFVPRWLISGKLFRLAMNSIL